MENNQIKKFAKVVLSYETLNDRFDLNHKIYAGWQDAKVRYNDYCSQDDDLVKAKEEYKKIQDIFAVNAGDYFYDTIVEEDYEYDEQIDDYYETESEYKKFNKQKFLFAKEAAENWEQIKLQLDAEEAKIKNSKFNIFKERNLQNVNKKRAYCLAQVEKYNKYKEKKDLQKYYEENKETIVKPLKDLIEKKEMVYANEVLEEVIYDNPYLICKEHKSLPYSYTPIERVFNNLREEVLDFIEEKAKEQLEKDEMLND